MQNLPSQRLAAIRQSNALVEVVESISGLRWIGFRVEPRPTDARPLPSVVSLWQRLTPLDVAPTEILSVQESQAVTKAWLLACYQSAGIGERCLLAVAGHSLPWLEIDASQNQNWIADLYERLPQHDFVVHDLHNSHALAITHEEYACYAFVFKDNLLIARE